MSYSQEMDVRGRKHEEISEYFYKVTSCKVEIRPMPAVRMGSIEFERVMVRVVGDQKEVTQVVEAFRLQFLTAGG